METAQEKRLRLIDFYLMFYGKINRSDLMKHGELSIATSSRAFTQYRELFPKNIEFDVGKKCYKRSDSFSSKFKHDPSAVLRMFAWGVEETHLGTHTYGVESFSRIIESISPDLLSVITRAIVAKKPLTVVYSSSRRTEERTFSPYCLFFGLGVWHVRGWDSIANDKKGAGRSFRITRFISADINEDAVYVEQEHDLEWQEEVILSLGPHSKHGNIEDLEWELEMDDIPIRNIVTNAALAGYILNDLRVDCSREASLPPNLFNIQLKNRHECEHIESIQFMGPGFFTN